MKEKNFVLSTVFGDIKPKLINSENFYPSFRTKITTKDACKNCSVCKEVLKGELTEELAYEVCCQECEIYYEV